MADGPAGIFLITEAQYSYPLLAAMINNPPNAFVLLPEGMNVGGLGLATELAKLTPPVQLKAGGLPFAHEGVILRTSLYKPNYTYFSNGEVFTKAFPGKYASLAVAHYDTVWLFALAVQAMGKTTFTADELVAAMSAASAGGTKTPLWGAGTGGTGGTAAPPVDLGKAALDAAKAGTDIDFDGCSGPIEIAADGSTPASAGLFDTFVVDNNNMATTRYNNIGFTYADFAVTRPTANAGADVVDVGTNSEVTLDGTASTNIAGVADTNLTYAWTVVSPTATTPPFAALAKFKKLTDGTDTGKTAHPILVTLDGTFRGTYSIRLIVTDTSGATPVDSAPDYVSVSVFPTNTKPVPVITGVPADPRSQDLITLSGATSTDVDKDKLTYSWKLLSQPTGSTVALMDATTATPSFVPTHRGGYEVELTLDDGFIAATDTKPTATQIITVNNTLPFADAGSDNMGAITNIELSLDGTGSYDNDAGDTLTYLWSFTVYPGASAPTFDNMNAAQPKFTATVVGYYVISLVVNDGVGNSEPDHVVFDIR
jgi:hypothetical protein